MEEPSISVREYGQSLPLLPVLDLMAGQAVAARAGERARYAPIRTPLVPGSDPVQVLDALLARCGTATAYVADLDAIMHGRPQITVLQRLLAARPDLTLWLDAGFADRREAEALAHALAPGRVLPVLGTETLRSAETLAAPANMPAGPGPWVLSLDFGAEGFRGDPQWLEDAGRWPDRIVVMSLASVGMDQGPDLARLASVLCRAGGRAVYAAGGVRHGEDLAVLARLGVAGALVASAVHAGRLPVASHPASGDNRELPASTPAPVLRAPARAR